MSTKASRLEVGPYSNLNFQPFDELGEVRIYYNGFLPHWRQNGCTYFVTFRLADSIPDGVLKQWEYERNKWLTVRGINIEAKDWHRKLKMLPNADKLNFERRFVSRFFESLDESHGKCELRRTDCRRIVYNALLHFHGERLDTGNFVIMPNHVHVLMTPYDGFELENILHSIKSYTSNQIHQILKSKGVFWMEESYDRIVRDSDELRRTQDYIGNNPEKANVPVIDYMVHCATFNVA